MKNKRTFWVLVWMLLATTLYFLIGNFETGWTILYSILVVIFFFLRAFFVGALGASQQQDNVEHMLDYFPQEKPE